VAVVQSKITEHDVVSLRRSIGGWAAGTWGTALIDHGRSKLVEISDEQGRELDLLEVAEKDLELIEHYP
jgi:hypothetical protein